MNNKEFIGFGASVNVTLGNVAFGVEFIWYTHEIVEMPRNPDNTERERLIPFIYVFGGIELMSGSIDYNSIVKSAAVGLSDAASNFATSSASISFNLIQLYGNTKSVSSDKVFSSPDMYKGRFDYLSATMAGVNVSTATDPDGIVRTVSVGSAFGASGISYGSTSYIYLSDLDNNIRNILYEVKGYCEEAVEQLKDNNGFEGHGGAL